MGEDENWYCRLNKKELIKMLIETNEKPKSNASHDGMDLLRSMRIYRQNNKKE